MEKIRVLIIDDHTLFREGLKALLNRQDFIEVVGEAGGGADGVKRAAELRPDVVLMDIKMPDMTGIEALSRIMELDPEMKVIVLTVSDDDEDLFTAVRTGASGYLLKNVETGRLVSSIYEVVRGGAALSGNLAGKIFREFREISSRRELDSGREPLSNREKEILYHITLGKSNKEIASCLDIAESTVKIHVQNLLRKLNLASRVEAAVYATRHGLFR